ncbi:MAG: HEAT repeat domain-containing protein [Caldilineaceae bacterium]
MTPPTLNPEQIAKLKQALQSDDAAVRFNAGLDLAKVGNPTGIPALIEAFEQESIVVRLFHASQALRKLGELAVPALSTALAAPNPQVQMAAAYTLYHIDPTRLDELLPLAITMLQSDHAQAALDALHFLGEVGPAAAVAVPALIDALHTPQPLQNVLAWFEDKRVLITALLAKIREPLAEITPALMEALGSEVVEVRWGAACALGEIGADAHAATALLAARARDEAEVELVRVEAAYALAVMGDPVNETLPVLLATTHSTDWWVRVFAVRILGEMGSPPAAKPGIEAFGWMDRVFMAVRNVRRVDESAEQIVPALVEALNDSDYNVRRNAAYALALIGEQAMGAISALTTALQQTDIGPTAAEALAKIGEAALPALTQALARDDEPVRQLAAYSLQLIDTSAAHAAIAHAATVRPLIPFTPAPQHFYVPVPVMLDTNKKAAFERLYQTTLAQGRGSAVDYTLSYPKHEFLRYLVEEKGVMIHGSGKADIDVLKPLRYGIDGADSGNVSGIYADKDYVRPIYFAIVNGKRAFGQNNGFFDLTPDGQVSEKEDQGLDRRFYKLAIGVNGLRRQPWRNGTIYILPAETFEYWNEWTSRTPVRPLMRLAVTPDDLPLLDQIWGSDWRNFDDGYWVKLTDPFPFLKHTRITPVHPNGRPPWA